MPPEDLEIYRRAGFGGRAGISQSPALLIIDVTYGFTGHRGMSVAEAVESYPNACVPAAWPAVDANVRLLGAARAAGIPTFVSRDVSGGTQDDSVWRNKHGRLEARPSDDASIVDELAPLDGELLEKSVPSAFFGGGLAQRLLREGVDGVVIGGTSTSGCVRATVVDAFSFGFSVSVVEECVFDRSPMSHAVSLFEMDQKYADVVTLDEAISHFNHTQRPGESTRPEYV